MMFGFRGSVGGAPERFWSVGVTARCPACGAAAALVKVDATGCAGIACDRCDYGEEFPGVPYQGFGAAVMRRAADESDAKDGAPQTPAPADDEERAELARREALADEFARRIRLELTDGATEVTVLIHLAGRDGRRLAAWRRPINNVTKSLITPDAVAARRIRERHVERVIDAVRNIITVMPLGFVADPDLPGVEVRVEDFELVIVPP